MFLAGTETAAMTMEWAMAEVVKHPRVMKKAQEEVRRVYGNKGYVDESELHQLTYISAIIRETLRLHPPLPLLLPRQTLEACELNGYIIPTKANVMVNVWAIARDPRYWDEPDVFHPERFIDSSIDYRGGSFEYMPFGAARRMCPGITFAAPILEVVVANLLSSLLSRYDAHVAIESARYHLNPLTELQPNTNIFTEGRRTNIICSITRSGYLN